VGVVQRSLPAVVTSSFKIHRCLCVLRNTKDRDLVVGDLHGHRELLEQALDQLGFDRYRDRVLSVGDLINRGPHSLATLSLLEEPWLHAVLGNHVLMLLNYLGYYGSRLHSHKSFSSGVGSWIVDAIAKHPKTIARLADRVAALPLAMHVQGDSSFNVTHGDLHPIGSRQEALLEKPQICVHEVDAAASSRVHFEAALRADTLGLVFAEHPVHVSDRPLGALPITYVGHSPIEQIVVHDSYVYIDQGVGTTASRRMGPTLPTVLDHRRFALVEGRCERARTRWRVSTTDSRECLKRCLPIDSRGATLAAERAAIPDSCNCREEPD
jgi:serine/threonine protein phosphatase 1